MALEILKSLIHFYRFSYVYDLRGLLLRGETAAKERKGKEQGKKGKRGEGNKGGEKNGGNSSKPRVF